MDLTKLNEALENVYQEDNSRIVFWNDPDQEFTSVLEKINLDAVNILRLDELGSLEVKIRIEREEPEAKFLLYSPAEEPNFDEDWLLDVRLYSRSFRADRSSIILSDLGLANQSMREHIGLRRKFFDSKERLRKLKQLIVPSDDELSLDRKMLAVIVNADQPELFNIIRALYHSMSLEDEINLDEPPQAWKQIEKFDLEDSFWSLVNYQFAYKEESPNLQNLLIRLFISDLFQHQDLRVPDALISQQLPKPGPANSIVCLAQWRDSASKGSSYNVMANEVATIIDIDSYLIGQEIEKLCDAITFSNVDKYIALGLVDRVRTTQQLIDADSIRQIVNKRLASHWVMSASLPEKQRLSRNAVYQAIVIAADFLALRNKYLSTEFHYDTAVEMYHAYETELFQFDQYYRLFCEHADCAREHGLDMLKELRKDIEAIYTNWYLLKMGLAWGKHVDAGLIGSWKIGDIKNQYEFYTQHVQPRLDEGDNRRVFVIISDAFRYEVAEELSRELNGKHRFEAELSSQLGVLPSYTALGMASLLPHETLSYKNNGDVLVENRPTSSLAYRKDILASVGGDAISGEDLIKMSKNEGRDYIADLRVVYVYHNEIDARGDTASTESGTFDAARKAINEVASFVSFIINNLNGYNVIVTADHGFLFSETSPDESDRSRLLVKPSGTVNAKKRYLYGHNLGEHEVVYHGSTKVTANADGDMEFWIPKSTNRFHFVGGARFLHGGAMPQEIVVPIVRVKHAKGGKRQEKTRSRKANVQVVGQNFKITTQKHRFQLLQVEAVNQRIKPAKLKIAIYEGDQAITNIVTVNFDSESTNMEQLQKDVILTLQDRDYDKRETYRLVLTDADNGIEKQSINVIIDRAIADEF